ncbi:unnamed protein product, partial [Mesorhabditis belari]|uniref:Uncharacterized protein n=1 Tax=Mesorhabditis belari TaxID=2138241 RepID=A0AAF3FFY4_9BILA
MSLFHPNRHSAQPSPPKVPYLASPEDLTSPESLNNNQRREFDPDLYEDRYNDPFEIEPRVHQRAPNRQSFEEPYPEDFDDEEKEEEHERTPMLRIYAQLVRGGTVENVEVIKTKTGLLVNHLLSNASRAWGPHTDTGKKAIIENSNVACALRDPAGQYFGGLRGLVNVGDW